MSPTQRNFKLLCLIEMILGVLVVVDGIVVGLSAATTLGAAGIIVLGALSAASGFMGARAANVPVTVGKTRPWFAVVLVLGAALVAAALLTDALGSPAPVSLSCAIPAILALLALLAAGKVLKETDRLSPTKCIILQIIVCHHRYRGGFFVQWLTPTFAPHSVDKNFMLQIFPFQKRC